MQWITKYNCSAIFGTYFELHLSIFGQCFSKETKSCFKCINNSDYDHGIEREGFLAT